MKNGTITFSKVLSYLLHPLLIPTLAVSLLMFFPDLVSIVIPLPLKLWFISVVFVFTVVIPVSAIFILFKVNAIQSIELTERNERTVPLLIASISYMALLYFLRSSNIPAVFLYVLYTAAFSMVAGLLINLAYKISLHTLGWSALLTALVSISVRMGTPLLLPVCVTATLAGLAGYARLNENAHNQTQVYMGYLAGICTIILILFLV